MRMNQVSAACTALATLADPEKAGFFPHFFKTGPGEYGEGDKFLGLTVPEIRAIAKEFDELPYHGIEDLRLLCFISKAPPCSLNPSCQLTAQSTATNGSNTTQLRWMSYPKPTCGIT